MSDGHWIDTSHADACRSDRPELAITHPILNSHGIYFYGFAFSQAGFAWLSTPFQKVRCVFKKTDCL
jgi:hypothetical protein